MIDDRRERAWEPPPLGNLKARLISAERAPTPAIFMVRGWTAVGSYSSLVEIPLNPPLLKGDFDSPLRKRGAGGDFHASVRPPKHEGL